LIASGKTVKDIAKGLYLTEKTTSIYRAGIPEKNEDEDK